MKRYWGAAIMDLGNLYEEQPVPLVDSQGVWKHGPLTWVRAGEHDNLIGYTLYMASDVSQVRAWIDGARAISRRLELWFKATQSQHNL